MPRTKGPAPEQGYRYIHGFVDPFPEFPALSHVNEAICAPDHVLHAHQHDVMELCYFVAGRAEWSTAQERVALGPGDFFISEPGEIHGGRPDPADPNHNFAIGFDPRHLPLGATRAALLPAPQRDLVDAMDESIALKVPARTFGQRVVHGGRGAEHVYRRILAELDGLETADAPQRALALVMVQALLVELFILLTRCLLAERTRAGVAPTAAPTRADIATLLRWLPTRLADPPTLAEMSEAVGLSPAHLVVVFKDELGRTPMEYLTRLRVDEAARRLTSSDRPVTDIALDLGFSSSQHFSVVFRRHLGRTPSQWRERR